MTRKDYEKIASTIKALPMTASERYTIASRFAEMLSADNALFDRSRFMKAATELVRNLEMAKAELKNARGTR